MSEDEIETCVLLLLLLLFLPSVSIIPGDLKKLRYAMQRSWNGHQLSSLAKLSCS